MILNPSKLTVKSNHRSSHALLLAVFDARQVRPLGKLLVPLVEQLGNIKKYSPGIDLDQCLTGPLGRLISCIFTKFLRSEF